MKWMKYKWQILFSLFFLTLLGWSPWITKSYAEQRVIESFNARWHGVVDGCGFNCTNCGVYKSEKTLFGYNVVILYSCGLKPHPNDIPDWDEKLFVSFLGTVHTITHERNLD